MRSSEGAEGAEREVECEVDRIVMQVAAEEEVMPDERCSEAR